MSAALEMTANAMLLPHVDVPRKKGENEVRDRDTSGLPKGAVKDAAAIRTQKVTMAAEHLASAPDDRTDDTPDHVDVFV